MGEEWWPNEAKLVDPAVDDDDAAPAAAAAAVAVSS